MITGYDTERCPFCGADSAYLHLQRTPRCLVRCGRCGAKGPEAGTVVEAVLGWTSRWQPKGPPRSPDTEDMVQCTDCGKSINRELAHFIVVTRGPGIVRDAVLCDDCFARELDNSNNNEEERKEQ